MIISKHFQKSNVHVLYAYAIFSQNDVLNRTYYALIQNSLVCYKKRKKVLTHLNAHLGTGLWLFVLECDSQPPRGDPYLQKHTEIEEIWTAIAIERRVTPLPPAQIPACGTTAPGS